jgi:hypothetical protein
VLIRDKDPLTVAALIHEVATDKALQDRIICSQDRALDRLLARDFSGTLLGFVDQVLSMPRVPPPPPAFDFWDQVTQAEALEVLRMHRPAAFQALPKGKPVQ